MIDFSVAVQLCFLDGTVLSNTVPLHKIDQSQDFHESASSSW
jgi:hypothetical protein